LKERKLKQFYVAPKVLASYGEDELKEIIKPHGHDTSEWGAGCGGGFGSGDGSQDQW
jgi:hypothetical protein